MFRFATGAARRVSVASREQKSVFELFPCSAEKLSRVGAHRALVDASDRVQRIENLRQRLAIERVSVEWWCITRTRVAIAEVERSNVCSCLRLLLVC